MRSRNYGQSSMMRGDLLEIDENGCFSNVPERKCRPRNEPKNLASALDYLQGLLVKKSVEIKFRHMEINGVPSIVMPELVMMYDPKTQEFIGSRQPTEQEKRQFNTREKK